MPSVPAPCAPGCPVLSLLGPSKSAPNDEVVCQYNDPVPRGELVAVSQTLLCGFFLAVAASHKMKITESGDLRRGKLHSALFQTGQFPLQ